MSAEWIAIGLLALLVLVFVLDVAANRQRVPRPKPVPQKKPEPTEGATPKSEPEAEEAPTEAEAAPERVPEPAAEPAPEPQETQVSVFERIRSGLGKTRANLTGGLADLFSIGKKVDEDLLEEIETTLLMADVGVTATSEIIDSLTEKLQRNQLKDGEALRKALRDELHGLLADVTRPLEIDASRKPYVILMVGVNGVGKTTTIGKLTKLFQRDGKSVMLAAGDTFRAAAVEQLQVWGERNNVPVVAQHTGADSASVIFDAVQSAQSRGVDVVIADTAGRLQNKDNLMSELEKVVRVMKKLDDTAPHEVMLVLDAGTGQNALSQAQVFQQAVGVSGITLTKLDGTAKGGIVFAIARQLQLPIRYIGVGEQVDDLRSFDARTFVDALFDENT
ncbi:signal recognition particle-docking protein FtsY [Marinobacter sp. HL-58]|uniref:signal recognition particle-docking protein FtsY n=1 Tax=Marinobacter sp. HL-58 TaxID=1479237 RepID=UPI00048077FF|nr:signal recognition particle-docking protein FtsY [Marinobacter sp. HL-58]KPP97421.1 MAG: fused signal recognition particle receptor FtsY [Marinobacter sp. HL-58]